jgi:hypothetical protein
MTSMPDCRTQFPFLSTASKKLHFNKSSASTGYRLPRNLSCCFVAAVITLHVCLAWAEDEIQVGHSAAGQLKVEVGFDPPLGLEVSVFSGIPGYATGEVGFHSAPFDEPTNDFFQLSTAADSRFILLAKDAGMEVWNDTGTAYMTVGQSFFMGQAPFDTHPVWNLVNGTPGNSYSLTLKVHDVNAVYTDSDPFILSFTPAPPVLSITNVSPGFVRISWEPATSGFVLQSSPSLNPPSWTNAPSGATNPVTLPAASPARYYRLRR